MKPIITLIVSVMLVLLPVFAAAASNNGITGLPGKVDELAQDVVDLQSQVDGLQAQVGDDLQGQIQQEIGSIQAQISGLIALIADLPAIDFQQQINDINNNIGFIGGELDSLAGTLGQLFDNVIGLQGQINDLNVNLGNLGGELNEIADIIGQFFEGFDVLEQRVSALDSVDGPGHAYFLAGRNFIGADFSNKAFEGTVFNSSVLQGADLSNSSFAGASFLGTSLRNANVQGAHFPGTNMFHADVSSVDFTVLFAPDGVNPDFTFVNMDQIAAANAIFDGVTLFGNSIRHAYLVDASFVGANLGQTEFQNANLAGVDFTGAILQGANFFNTYAITAIFTNAQWGNTICPNGSNSDNSVDGTCFDQGIPRP